MKIQTDLKVQVTCNVLCKSFSLFLLYSCGGNKPVVMHEEAPVIVHAPANVPTVSISESEQPNEQIVEIQSERNELKGTIGKNTNKPYDYINVSYYELYDYALSVYFQKKCELALSEFYFLLRKFPNHPLSSNCQYWIGECHYEHGEYQKALLAFQKVSVHPNKKKYDDAQLMTAYCYENLGRKNEALKTLEAFLASYPHSEFAPVARIKKTRIEEQIKQK